MRRSHPQPTLKTLALMTGLGVTTVSRALKDAPELSTKTKKLVREVAERVGYRPHRAGVRLRTGRTFVISFILNQADDMSDYGRRLIMGISEGLRGTQYHLQVLPELVGQDPIAPVRYVVDTAAADGVILTHSQPDDARVKLLLERDLPFITYGQTSIPQPHPFIDYCNISFAYRATRELAQRGRRRIMIVLPPGQYTYSVHQREGYLKALAESGLTPLIADDIDLYSPASQLRDYAARLAAQGEPPDGIICGSELQALGMMLGFQGRGLVVGRDIDIVNKKTSDILDIVPAPTLQFTEDLLQVGRDLACFLMRRIDGVPASSLQRLDYAPLRRS
ncbi:LacI family transcriptional regulator [soil metagenome]